jgi:ABC-2 type transport system permease protein
MTAARYLIGLGNEVHKGLMFAWSERLQILIELPMFAVIVLLLGPLFGSGSKITSGQLRWSLDSGRISVLLLWFTVFAYFYMQSVKLFWRLLREIQTGTLEQVYLSPLPYWLVAAAGRVVAALIESMFVAAAMYGLVRIFVPLHYHWSVTALLPAGLLVVSAIGYSLVIGGLTLVWKRIEMLQDSLLTVLLIASVGAVPLIAVPHWLATGGRAFPMTSFLASLYGVLLGHKPAFALWGTGGLVWMLITAAAYLAVGILAFRLGEQTAKRRGTLGHY